MLQLACFDFDGTLFSTEQIHRDSVATVVQQATGESISADESAAYSGIPYIDRITAMLRLRDLYSEEYAWELEQAARVLTAKKCEDAKALLTPGVESLLQDLRENNIPMVIVSSGKRTIIEHDLQSAGIDHYFETIIAIEDVQKIKPDPAPYLQALEKFGVTAADAVAFEDSPHGAHAAIAAGIPTIGILTTARADELIGAKKTVRDFTELSFESIARLVQ
jgi:putative hydrolase of the HAD superfamily